MKIYTQQGDCILEEVEKVPENAKKLIVKNSFVVERGEGVHTHCLVADKLTDKVDIYEADGTYYISTNEDVNLVHEEHGTTVLPARRKFRKVVERVFDYEQMESRKVID